MFGLGMSEIIVLGIIALVVIGPKELPQMARTIGRFMNELKRSTNILSDEIKEQVRYDEKEIEEAIRRKREELRALDEETHMSTSDSVPESSEETLFAQPQTPSTPEPEQLSFNDSTNKKSGDKA